MRITLNSVPATNINDVVVSRILNLYPEEKLIQRITFVRAFQTGSIELKCLKDESDKILIPWQMFFLNEKNFDDQIKHIETQRKHKVSSKLLSKRRGSGSVTSKRIIDRLIRQQNFLIEQNEYDTNIYCGLIYRKSVDSAVRTILSHFGIERDELWGFTKKQKAFDYLLKKIESKSINVSQGVLTNKLLPNHQVVGNDIYKNTSGFVIKNDCVPFIFLPSEINPDEAISRQIYTLIYLLVVIGLNQYTYILEKNFRASSLTVGGIEARIHAITSELLIPQSELIKYTGQTISIEMRDTICNRFKVTPLALTTTLKIRGLITESEYDELKPEPYLNKKTKIGGRSPLMSTSIKKFCGAMTYQSICSAIQTQALRNTQAQYLIFGSINKKGFRRFRTELM